MNILVIGANGKAGHRIVEKALKVGHQVSRRCSPQRCD